MASLASSSRSFIARSKPSLLSCVPQQLPSKAPFSSCKRLRNSSTVAATTQHEQSTSVSSMLRAQPWDFKTQDAPSPRTRQDRLAVEMQAAADKKDFTMCLGIAAEMKAQGIKPDISVYNALMSAAASDGHSWLEAWAILDDMLLVGVKPNVTTFNHLLRAQEYRASSYIWEVIKKMEELDVLPDTHIYTQLIERFVEDKNMEMALQFLFASKAANLLPELQAAEAVVLLVAELGYPRLAIDLVEWYESDSVRRMDHVPWLSCLTASAQSSYAQGIITSWDMVTKAFKIAPNEGLCIDVLNACGRHGLHEIALEAIVTLKAMGATLQEYHYAPAIEAAAKAQNIEKGLHILNGMALNNVMPTEFTVLPIVELIGTDLDTLDSAVAFIDAFHRKELKLSVLPLQTIITAAVSLDDLQRAIGVYKSFSEYGVVPDLQTYHVLLQGCINAAHSQLGDLLLKDLKELKVKPDKYTYELMARIHLTQQTYEQAFFYLEEMKDAGLTPPATLYEAIIQRCIANDDFRYSIAMDELQELGYPIREHIRELLKKTKHQREEIQDTRDFLLDEEAQKYIETGGVESRS